MTLVFNDYTNMVRSWFVLPDDLSVGNTITGFINPLDDDLINIYRPYSEYYCFVDGVLVARKKSDNNTNFECFISNCVDKSLFLDESVHLVSFVLPYNDGYIMIVKCINPVVNGEKIVADNENLLEHIGEDEKLFMQRVECIVILCDNDNDEEEPEPEVERFKITEITDVKVMAGLGGSSTNRRMGITFTLNPAWTGGTYSLNSNTNFSINSNGGFDGLTLKSGNLILEYTGNPNADIVVAFSGDSEIEPFTLSFHVNMRNVTNLILE